MPVNPKMQREFEEWLHLAPAKYTLAEKVSYAIENFTREINNYYERNYFKRMIDETNIVSDV